MYWKISVNKSSLVAGVGCSLLTLIAILIILEVLQRSFPSSPYSEKLPWALGLAFVLFVWVLTRGRHSFLIGYISGLCGVPILLVVALLAGPTLRDYAMQTSFDEARWKQEADSGQRVWMVDGLLHKYSLVGWSQERVEQLLGKPPASEYFKTECDWLYWLGPERGFISIDSEWLCLKFQEALVIKATIVRD
ncbi:MAG: hypothetical protein P0120_06650 [Nitrospira sp.]|nr:hypothetical protein [Nitrospira sp.]